MPFYKTNFGFARSMFQFAPFTSSFLESFEVITVKSVSGPNGYILVKLCLSFKLLELVSAGLVLIISHSLAKLHISYK